MEKYFRPAGDLTDTLIKDNVTKEKINSYVTKEEIDEYLKSIVSGVVLEDESEFGMIIGSGAMVVSLSRLQEMVEEGTYNIIRAEYFNPEMISIVYQKYNKNNVRSFR